MSNTWWKKILHKGKAHSRHSCTCETIDGHKQWNRDDVTSSDHSVTSVTSVTAAIVPDCLPATCYCVASMVLLLFGLVTLMVFTASALAASGDGVQWAAAGRTGGYVVMGLGVFCLVMVMVIVVRGRRQRRRWQRKRESVTLVIAEGVELRDASTWPRPRPSREHRYTPHPRLFHLTRPGLLPPSPSLPPPRTLPPPTYDATPPPAHRRPWLPPPQFAALPPGTASAAGLRLSSPLDYSTRRVDRTQPPPPPPQANGATGERAHVATEALLQARVSNRFLYDRLRLPTLLPGGARRCLAPEAMEGGSEKLN